MNRPDVVPALAGTEIHEPNIPVFGLNGAQVGELAPILCVTDADEVFCPTCFQEQEDELFGYTRCGACSTCGVVCE
jgi:hypothetical protein